MSVLHLLTNATTTSGASPEALRSIAKQLNIMLPDDYAAALRESDGFEGFVSDDHYFVLWSTQAVVNLNASIRMTEFLPGAVAIGGNGADEAHAFRWRDGAPEYFSVPLTSLHSAEEIPMGRSLVDLMSRSV